MGKSHKTLPQMRADLPRKTSCGHTGGQTEPQPTTGTRVFDPPVGACKIGPQGGQNVIAVSSKINAFENVGRAIFTL